MTVYLLGIVSGIGLSVIANVVDAIRLLRQLENDKEDAK